MKCKEFWLWALYMAIVGTFVIVSAVSCYPVIYEPETDAMCNAHRVTKVESNTLYCGPFA